MTGESIPGVECMGKVVALGSSGRHRDTNIRQHHCVIPRYLSGVRPFSHANQCLSHPYMSSNSLQNWLAVSSSTTEAELTTLIGGDVGEAWAANNVDSLELARVWSDMKAVMSGRNYSVLWKN